MLVRIDNQFIKSVAQSQTRAYSGLMGIEYSVEHTMCSKSFAALLQSDKTFLSIKTSEGNWLKLDCQNTYKQ